MLVQSEAQAAQTLARFFKGQKAEVYQSWDIAQAHMMLDQVRPELVVMDLHYPGNDWTLFLRRVMHNYPNARIILSSKFPDLQREMTANQLGIFTFVRQPFEDRWLQVALKKVYSSDGKKAAVETKADARVRVPVRMKITLPYLLLALLFAVAGAYVVSQIVLESAQERFFNQLVKTGKQASDWMVRQEDRQLSTLRLVANSQGVGETIQAGDSEALRNLALPLAVNASEEAIEILDKSGTSLMSMHLDAQGTLGQYTYTRGETVFQAADFVQMALKGSPDELGDKYAGLITLPAGAYFYVAGPVFSPNSQEPIGVVMVGRSVRTLVRQMEQETLGQITMYDLDGQPIVSTLFSSQESFPLAVNQARQALALKDTKSMTRPLTVSGIDYTEMVGAWEVRGNKILGVMGVALTQTVLVRTSQTTQFEIFMLVAVAILLVIIVGLLISSMITYPLQRLVSASTQVARGNLEIKVDVRGDDEMAVLAQSFNRMIAELQEGVIYRDLLGRTVSPEVREQLRNTFKSGNVRLEGQEALATVLMTDIRGFTSLSEKAEPAQVFEWLNDYFGRLVPIITAHGGVVNKFDGDAVLAFFGILPVPLDVTESAKSACLAAVEMLDEINKFNQERLQNGLPELVTGIGINTGLVMAGGLGTSDRMHYTVIGDTVNTTQRLEALTRQIYEGNGIVIGQLTYSALGEHVNDFILEPAGHYAVKGKAEQVQVYRLSPFKVRVPEPTP
jgi:adenylate cyclase